MIKFKTLKIRNFLSINSIDVEFKTGMTFVRGTNLDDSKSTSNGSGKSSVFDALSWVLYGETSKGKSSDSVVNKQSGVDTEVEVSFSKLEEEYTITRYRKHSLFGDDIKIVLDNKDISVKGIRQSQDLIFKIFGISKNIFESTILITQGFNSRFSLLTETERRLLFERIRNVEVWDKARDISKKKAASIDKELIQTSTKIQTYLNEMIPALEVDLKKNQDQLQEYSSKLQQLQPDYSQVEGLNNTIQEEIKRQQAVQAKQRLIQEKIENSKKLLLDLEPIKNQNKKNYEIVSNSFNQIQSELKYIPAGACGICGKNTEDFYRDKIDNLSKKLSEVKEQKVQFEEQLKVSEVNYQSNYHGIQELYQKNSSMETTLNQSIQLTERTKRQLQEVEQEYERNKQLIIQKLDIFEKSIQEIQSKIKSLNTSLIELQNTSKVLDTNLGVYKELDGVFSPKGIRSYLIAQDLETVNSSLEDYSEFLFSNATARLIFKGESLESSKISIELEDSMQNIFDYSDCSGGQSRRIDLLIQLSIRDLIFNISNLNANVLVLDEIFDSLDREGVLSVLNLVRTYYKDFCVYIISQIHDLPYEYFDNTLSLRKLNGITVLD